MTGRAKLILALLVAALCAVSHEARADSLTITGGTFSQQGESNVPTYSLTGQGFGANGLGGDTGAHMVGCAACAIGSVVNIKVNFGGMDLGGGSALINGVSYSGLSFRGSFEFLSTGIVGPPPDPLYSIVTVTTSFTLTGDFRAYVGNPDFSSTPLTPIFSTAVSGTGMATFQFVGLGGFGAGPYVFSSVTYTFQAAPVPEPATLLLLGTGLAGVAAKARRRRVKRNPPQA